MTAFGFVNEISEAEVFSVEENRERSKTVDGAESSRSFNTRLLKKAEDIIERLQTKKRANEQPLKRPASLMPSGPA